MNSEDENPADGRELKNKATGDTLVDSNNYQTPDGSSDSKRT